MADTVNDNAPEREIEGAYLKNKSLARWGCFLVVLMVVALFIIVFIYGQFAAMPGKDGVGP